MTGDSRLDELLQAWGQERSLDRDRAQDIRDKIKAGEVQSYENKEEMNDAAGGQNPTGDHRWWFKLYQETTVESINRVNAAFDYGFKSA